MVWEWYETALFKQWSWPRCDIGTNAYKMLWGSSKQRAVLIASECRSTGVKYRAKCVIG